MVCALVLSVGQGDTASVMMTWSARDAIGDDQMNLAKHETCTSNEPNVMAKLTYTVRYIDGS